MQRPGDPPQRILITGGAGFFGSHFAEVALKNECSIAVLDAMTYSGNSENLDSAAKTGRVEFIYGSSSDASLVSSLFAKLQPDAVLNFAGASHVDRSISDPSGFVDTNIIATRQLLDASLEYWRSLSVSRQTEFRFVQISTDEVFGSVGKPEFRNEASPYRPSTPYAATKAAADLLIEAWHKTYGLPVLITHNSNLFGPRQFPEKLVPATIRLALENQPIPLYGDGENIRDWSYVTDGAEAVWLALTRGIPGNHYCFSGHCEKTNREIVNAVCGILDRLCPRSDGKPHASAVQQVPDRFGHDLRHALDDSLARTELRYLPQVNFLDGLQRTVRWYLDRAPQR